MSEETNGAPAAPEDSRAVPEGASASREELLLDAKEDVLDFLEGLLDAMELAGDVSAELMGDGIASEISGTDAELLVGPRGQTLDAIQELVRTAVQSQAQARIRVALDIGGYRAKRAADLDREVREMAAKALADGTDVGLEPMSAYERKIVHDTVGTIEGVTSLSEGQDPRRRVIIKIDHQP